MSLAKREISVLLVAGMLIVLLGFVPAEAQAQGNYVPLDPSTLPQAPGCTWYPSTQYPGTYESWCGSDEIGWYRPYEWYLLTGYYPPAHGLEGG
jgi:hypothetical protein